MGLDVRSRARSSLPRTECIPARPSYGTCRRAIRRLRPDAVLTCVRRARDHRLEKLAHSAAPPAASCTRAPPISRARSPKRRRDLRPARQQVQILEERVFFGRVRREPSGRSRPGISLNEPTSDTITALPRPSDAHQRAGIFPDRRIAQIQDDVAGRDISDEILDRREAQHAHMRRQVRASRIRALKREFRMRLAHQDHLGVGLHAQQPAKGPQRFGDALVRLQESEDADRAASSRPGPACWRYPSRSASGIQAPCGMRAIGPVNPALPQLVL